MSTLTAGMTVQGTDEAYVLDRVLGRGGFGVTWKANRVSDGQVVALKQLHVSRGDDYKSLELFKREIRTLRALEHPRIPAYVDDFLNDGLVLVQGFVDGDDLAHVVRGEVAMDEAGLVSWMGQILEVLVYLHGLTPPVIHRDITPNNIIVRPDGSASLVDFGAVKFGVAGSTASTSTGTFGYAPMEQFVGQAFPASDLYGLGMTAVAVASGKAPVDMKFTRMRVDVRGSTRLDPRLTTLLERMTEPDPERRLSDARVALEQLRPLLTRYGSGRGPALRALAERSVSSRVIPDEDLLPSERMREARLRLQTLTAPLDVPPLSSAVHDVTAAQISPDGTVLVVDHHVIDTHRMAPIATLPVGLHPVAVSAAGAVIVAREDAHASELRVYRRTRDRYKQSAKLPAGATEHAAISADGQTLATIAGFFAQSEGALQLFDLASGQLSQRVPGKFEGATFGADGSLIAARGDDDRLHLLAADGATTIIDACSAVAFAPDGHTMAIVSDCTLRFGSIASRGTDGPQTRFARSVRVPAFSPDGRWFAAVDYSDDQVVVFDARTGERVLTLDDPGAPGQKISSPNALGFSVDGERLFVACDVNYSRLVGADEDCVAVWRVPDGAYLGAIMRESDGRGAVLLTAQGFFGSLDGQRLSSAESAAAHETPWWAPEVARRALCGTPVDELIDAQTRAALQDLQARHAFFMGMKADARLDANAPMSRLLDATRGLTHVLDGVVRAARATQASRPSFGGGAAAALTADQICAAAEVMARRPASELDALHAELLAAAEAREAEAAADAAAKAPKVRSRALMVQDTHVLARPRTLLWATVGGTLLVGLILVLKLVLAG